MTSFEVMGIVTIPSGVKADLKPTVNSVVSGRRTCSVGDTSRKGFPGFFLRRGDEEGYVKHRVVI